MSAGSDIAEVATAEGVRDAASISVTSCKHAVWLRLHDDSGAVFAVAVMPWETASTVVNEIAEELARQLGQATGKAVLQ